MIQKYIILKADAVFLDMKETKMTEKLYSYPAWQKRDSEQLK